MIKLLEPVKVGGLQLRNRIVMAAMTRSRALGNVPNLLMVEYYKQRSSAGLIVTEGTAPSPDGLGYCRTPGIFSKEQIEGWKAVTKAVHEAGGAIFLQILHTGRIAAKQNLPSGGEIVAPSAVAAIGKIWTDTDQMVSLPVPREMTLTDIAAAIADYKEAAINAMAAGFDGVELHAATGYLPNQFLSNHANQRTDEYGGTIEKRSRFVIAVLKAMSDAIGGHKVGIKFSPGMTYNDSGIDDAAMLFPYLLKQINALDLAYVCVMRLPGYELSENGFDVIKVFREIYKGTLMVNLGYDKKSGEEVLLSGQADLVAYGSLFISNPDLPARFALDVPLAAPDQNTYYSSGAAGFTDYLAFGE